MRPAVPRSVIGGERKSALLEPAFPSPLADEELHPTAVRVAPVPLRVAALDWEVAPDCATTEVRESRFDHWLVAGGGNGQHVRDGGPPRARAAVATGNHLCVAVPSAQRTHVLAERAVSREHLGRMRHQGELDPVRALFAYRLMSHFELVGRRHADTVERHSPPEYAPVRPLLTVPELARVMRVGRTTVYRLVRNGSIRPVVVGERMRFRPEDIERYLERGDSP